MPKILVLGMGNRLLSDDAVGLLVAEEVRRVVSRTDVEVVCGEVAGFRLVDILSGYDVAIVVDAIISDRAPIGEVYWLEIDELRQPLRHKSNHNIHLADAIELGKGLGMDMPEKLRVLAIEVEDCFTLSEEVGQAALKSIPNAVAMVLEEIEKHPTGEQE